MNEFKKLRPGAPIAETICFTDGFGNWRARINFSHTLSENDPQPEFNLGHQLPRIRRIARTAIVAELVAREQKTHETREQAEVRIRAALPRLVVIDQGLDAQNLWHWITLGEPAR